MSGQYILDASGEPEYCDDLMTWGRWMETGDRIIAKDKPLDGVSVSTVFLGLDHSFGEGPPILFETMVFGGEHDGEMERYTSKEAAIEGHKRMLQKVTV